MVSNPPASACRRRCRASRRCRARCRIVVAAEGVIPGQPVAQHRRLVGEQRQDGAQHLLVGAEHPLGIDHALRDDRSIPMCRESWRWCRVRPAVGRSAAAVGRRRASSAKAVERSDGAGAQVTISVWPGQTFQRRTIAMPVVGKDQAGPQRGQGLLERRVLAVRAASRLERLAHTCTPRSIAASASSACSMLLPDRMTTGRSTESARSSSSGGNRADALERGVDTTPAASALPDRGGHRNGRSGACRAQCSRRSVSRAG